MSYTVDSHYDLNLWSADDGELLATVPYSYTFSINNLVWQPNGSMIAVALDFEVFEIMDSVTSQIAIEFQGHTEAVTGLDWSPDGSRIASSSRDDTIRVWDVATTSSLLIITDTSDVYGINWSPDGTKLASINAENDVKIWDVSSLPDVSGTPTVTPLPTLTPTVGPTPTPTATSVPNALDEIAFTRLVSDGGGDREQIFTMNLNGSELANFSDNLYSEYDPVWSPDGTRIAFTSTRSGGTPHIFVRDLSDPDPNNAIQVTSGASSDYAPAWSPDSQKIAFTSERDGNKEIYIAQADGSTINNPTQVTNNPADDFDPDWSINSNYIVFISTRNDSQNIYIANLERGFITNITDNSSNYYAPRWSPDGQRIAFAADLLTGGDPQLDIYVMSSDGQSVISLNTNGQGIQGLDWSPDGRQIVFDSSHEGNSQIYVVNVNGSSMVRVTNDTEDNYDPAWAPGQGSVPTPCDYSVPSGSTIELVEAIDQANANSAADIICLETDGYYSISDTGSAPILPVISTDITIKGNGASIVRDLAAPPFRIFYVDASGILHLDNVTISNGSLDEGSGGGIYNLGSLTITNSTISNNLALDTGGGVYNMGTLVINNSDIVDNYTAYFGGGGVMNDAGTMEIINSTITGNAASWGGGVDTYLGTTTITGSIVANNTANSGVGGGIDNYFGTVNVSDSLIQGNNAVANSGGGVASNANTTIDNSCIMDNTASDGIDVASFEGAQLNAVNNWWGGTDGRPSGEGLTGTGETINADVLWDPPLANPPSACSLGAPTATPTPTETPTNTPTDTPSPTATDTPTATPTATDTPTNTPTNTPTATSTPTPTATPTPVVVSNNNLQGWTFTTYGVPPVYSFILGPGTPPLGSGSLSVIIGVPTSKLIMYAPLTNITTVSSLLPFTYSTYRSTTLASQFYVNLYLDTDGNPSTCETRLDFAPTSNNINTWESWNAGTGTWRQKSGGCFGSGTFTNVTLSSFSTANVLAIAFNMGDTASSYVNFNGAIDAIIIGGITYDFELSIP
jgi:Tol biopolymer transport system component